jgi:hypothetical protein
MTTTTTIEGRSGCRSAVGLVLVLLTEVARAGPGHSGPREIISDDGAPWGAPRPAAKVVMVPPPEAGTPPAAPRPPAASPRPRGFVIAVLDVADTSGRFDRRTLGELTEYLSTRLTEALGYRVVPREQVLAKLREAEAASYRPCIDASCQIELGKALAAEKTLSTKILRLGSHCTLTSTLFDLKTETAEAAASVHSDCSLGSMAQALDRLVRGVGEQADRKG